MGETFKGTKSAEEGSSIGAGSQGHNANQRVITEAERRAVRKLDYAIIPVMTMFYLLSFLVSNIFPYLFKKKKLIFSTSGSR